MLRVGLIVQRYGMEVNGGAELLCRMVAERLAGKLRVEVLTTCAVDYVSWNNEYPPGPTSLNGVPVLRFPVDAPRDSTAFNNYSNWLYANPHTRADELTWIELQGPRCTQLLGHLQDNGHLYDALVFYTYLYYPTCLGLPLVKERALLVPAAHDEPPVYLNIYDEIFHSARGILCSTPEERDFVLRRFCPREDLVDVVGVGFSPPQLTPLDDFWTELQSQLGASRVITYVGRIDRSKGCEVMIDYFLRYIEGRADQDLKLLLIGKAAMSIPPHPAIIQAGFVSETVKYRALEESQFLLMPSPYESLSFALLEAWFATTPVLVNADCRVLREQCRRSNGGLWYSNYEEFAAAADRLLVDGSLRSELGRQGKAYVLANYNWDCIERKYHEILNRVADSTAPPPLAAGVGP